MIFEHFGGHDIIRFEDAYDHIRCFIQQKKFKNNILKTWKLLQNLKFFEKFDNVIKKTTELK